MRRIAILVTALAWATGASMALALPAAAEVVEIVRHGSPDVQSSPLQAAPRSGFADGGFHDHFGLQPNSPGPEQPAAPSVARYMVQNTIGFTLDTSGPQPLLRFNNSAEVWALKTQPAPRGDTLYVNDAGEAMLRATRLGGLTAFTQDQPQGVAAAYIGSAQPIVALPDIDSGAQLLFRMRQQSGHLSHVAGHTIGFDASDLDVGPEGLPLIADTFNVAMDAFMRVFSPQNSKKKTLVTDLGEVRIKEGVPPDAFVQNNALVIVITPGRGIAGRPSSQRIFKILMH